MLSIMCPYPSCLQWRKEAIHCLIQHTGGLIDCGCLELFIFLGAHGRGSVTCHGWHISVGWRVWSAFSKHTSLAHPVMCIQFQTTCKPWNYKNTWSFVVIIQNVLETCLRNSIFHKLSKHLWTCIWLPFVLLPNTLLVRKTSCLAPISCHWLSPLCYSGCSKSFQTSLRDEPSGLLFWKKYIFV